MAADISAGKPGESATESTRNAPKQSKPSDSWFNPAALDLNIYGLAYHPDRETVHRKNLDNQVNPGLGLHYELTNSELGIAFAEAGAYYNEVAAFGFYPSVPLGKWLE